MAFNIAPTSGTAPYTFTAEFSNKLGVELGLYGVELLVATSVGSCPSPPITGVNQSVNANILFNTGTFVQTGGTIASGSCRNHNLLIREISSGSIVSQLSALINNV